MVIVMSFVSDWIHSTAFVWTQIQSTHFHVQSTMFSSPALLLQVQHVGAWGTHPGPAFGAGLRREVRLVCHHLVITWQILTEVETHLEWLESPYPLLTRGAKYRSFLDGWSGSSQTIEMPSTLTWLNPYLFAHSFIRWRAATCQNVPRQIDENKVRTC